MSGTSDLFLVLVLKTVAVHDSFEYHCAAGYSYKNIRSPLACSTLVCIV